MVQVHPGPPQLPVLKYDLGYSVPSEAICRPTEGRTAYFCVPAKAPGVAVARRSGLFGAHGTPCRISEPTPDSSRPIRASQRAQGCGVVPVTVADRLSAASGRRGGGDGGWRSDFLLGVTGSYSGDADPDARAPKSGLVAPLSAVLGSSRHLCGV